MNTYSKPPCDIIIICFPDKTIFILLDCFTQLLQTQRLAKYDQYVTSSKGFVECNSCGCYMLDTTFCGI